MALDVIGREEELEAIHAFLADVERGPQALVLFGEPGIGKTILWEEGVERAGESYVQILTCRGVEAEASLSFAGLSDLLGDEFEEAAPALVPLRRHALEIALRLAEPGEEALDTHTIGLAVLDLLATVSERGAVLVALDDLQWLDQSSAGVLQMALRRLGSHPVGFLATLRRAPGVAISSEFERAFPEAQFAQLELRPLSVGALHQLLKERLGLDLTRPELARMQEATAGNPFFALELGRELVRTGTRPSPGQALRVPESLRELLGDRLARLPAEVVDVLLQVAALARPTVELVASTYGDRERVLEALESAVLEGVVALEDSRIRFVHPLVASICYEQAPVWKRRAVHRALSSAVTDVEERARHLALAAEGPDASVAAELERAAEQAAGRGAPMAAAELCELAADLTPDDDGSGSRRRRLFAARCLRRAGDTDRTVDILRRLRDEIPAGVERGDVLFELALTQRGTTDELVEQCDEALAAVGDDDARAARILAVRSGHYLLKTDVSAALASVREGLERAERTGDPALLAQVIAYAGQVETYRVEITPGLLERGIAIEDELGLELEWNLSPRYVLGRRRMRMGDLDGARAALERFEAEAHERGDEVSRELALWPLAMVEWLAGRWDDAQVRAKVAYELTVQTQHPHARFWVGRAKALIEADLGLVEDARATAEEALSHARIGSELYTNVAEAVLGRVELMLGNLEAAGDRLRGLPDRLVVRGMNDPTFPLWADLFETLAALGEIDPARAHLEQYVVTVDRLDSPLAREYLQRSRGLVSAAAGDLDAALEAFELLVRDQPDPPWPFERARTLLAFGVVRRQAQQKRAAREAIEAAIATFDELGAVLWAEKAHGELRRISGRRAAPEALTETEHRVSLLATEGRTNKEIAAALYMGASTVEAHLSRVYRKLGIRSRAELQGALANIDAAAPNTRDETAQA